MFLVKVSEKPVSAAATGQKRAKASGFQNAGP